MTELTERQHEILLFIRGHIEAKGYPPTLREIGTRFAIRSTNGVNDHLRALERKGHIVRRDRLSRGMRVVSPLTGETAATPYAALVAVKAENEALITLLRRVSAAGGRATMLTAELAVVLGDVRSVVGSAA